MSLIADAIYENGVLRPLRAPELAYLRSFLIGPFVLASLSIVATCHGGERQQIDRFLAALQSGDDVAAGDALARLPRSASSDTRAQEAVVAYVRRQEELNRTLTLHLHGRCLSGFDASFALRAVSELKQAKSTEGKMLWLLIIGNMRSKAPQARPALESLLSDGSVNNISGSVRMVLILFGPNREDLPWLANQIKGRTAHGVGAIEVAGFLGLGAAAKDEAVRTALADWLNIVEKDDATADERYALPAALALAVSGCDDRQSMRRVKELFERAKKDEDAGAIAMVYAYALSRMDRAHEKDHWRFILSQFGGPEAGRTGTAAFLYCVPSLPDSGRNLITELQHDLDRDVKHGAKEAVKILKLLMPK